MRGKTELYNEQMAGPYKACEIPRFDIDYRGLAAYARSKGKKIFELSDEEKNMFIHNATVEEVNRKAIKL